MKRLRTHRGGKIASVMMPPSQTAKRVRLIRLPGSKIIMTRPEASPLLINAKTGTVRELNEGSYFG